MSIFPRSFSSILIVVAFIVLAILASLAYNSESDESSNLKESQFYQGTKTFVEKAFWVAKSLSNVNSVKNSSLADKMTSSLVEKKLDNLGSISDLSIQNNNSLVNLEEKMPLAEEIIVSKTFAELKNNLKEGFNEDSLKEVQPNLKKIISFEKMENGLEIILRIKNEEERKIILPLKLKGGSSLE